MGGRTTKANATLEACNELQAWNCLGVLVAPHSFLSLRCLDRFSAAAGQTAATGQIVGTVTDPSKAAIAQASVTATNEATGQSRTAKAMTKATSSFRCCRPVIIPLSLALKASRRKPVKIFCAGR